LHIFIHCTASVLQKTMKRIIWLFVIFQNMCSFMPLLRGPFCNRIVTESNVSVYSKCVLSLLSLSQTLLWFRLVCITIKTSDVILIVLSARVWLTTCLCSYLRPHSDVHLFRSRPCCDWWSGCCHCLHHALSPHRPRQIPHQTQRYCTLTHLPNQTKKSLALFHTHAQI